MNKYIIIILAIFMVSISGCQKENDKSIKSIKMSDELATLYQEVPNFNFGNISLVNGDILRFESEEHYEGVYNALLQQYEAWSDIFFMKYDKGNEIELDSIIDALGFDDCTPLLLFEEQLKVLDKNLREIWVNNENTWLARGAEGALPIDEIVNCPIEQTLYSQYHEVCIGDTIYQLRSDGLQVLIPISKIEYLPEIRAAKTESDLNSLPPGLFVIPQKVNACYKDSYSKSGMQYHPEVGEKRFEWTYNYQKAVVGHKWKTTVTMHNYKKKNGQWKKDNAVCALGLRTKLYRYVIANDNCADDGYNIDPLNTPDKYYSRTSIKYTLAVSTIPDTTYTVTIGNFTFYPDHIELEKRHVDPAKSYTQCRHDGWTYQFNAASGNLEQ